MFLMNWGVEAKCLVDFKFIGGAKKAGILFLLFL